MKKLAVYFYKIFKFFSKKQDVIKPGLHLHFDYNIYGKCKCNIIETNSLYNEYNFESGDFMSIIFSHQLIYDLSNSIFINYDYDIIEKCLNFAKQKFQIYESDCNFVITKNGIMIGGRKEYSYNMGYVGCSDFFKLHYNIHNIEKSYNEYKKNMNNHPTKLIISVD
jgi:hypothetical protein